MIFLKIVTDTFLKCIFKKEKITMKKNISIKIAMGLFFCLLLVNAIAQKPKPVAAAKPKPVAVQSKIKNNIQLKTNGFKVSEAYLIFDDGTAVPQDNKVDLNQKITLLIIIDAGWKVTDSLVYPGASEKVVLSNGYEVLNNDDLFTAYTEKGVNAADARYISLKAVITQIDNKKNYIIVKFRVWDKKGTSSLSGSYKFFIK
jgi:hypothetical protein